jgi:ATP-dependent Clp protease, protease subunit
MKHNLPLAPSGRIANLTTGFLPSALARWDPSIRAEADAEDASVIEILDPIGYDPWSGGGVTAKGISVSLKALNGAPANVVINSPGGDAFEGFAIYNLLRDYAGDVNVKVVGVAASAASYIAMAGDNIQIARAAFYMVHNTWVVAMGNRNDLRDYADTLEPFDMAMADIYAARTGLDIDAVAKMMDKETWIGGADAVKQGFADDLLPADKVSKQSDDATKARSAAYKLDAALAKAGLARAERREILRDYRDGMLRAADEPGMPGASESPLSKIRFNQPFEENAT